MRLIPLIAFLFLLSLPLAAAPPNDNFAARISLVGNPPPVIADSIDATIEAGENTQNGFFGATVWWSWISPVNGWARVDTTGSSFETVIQISTGSTLATQTYLGFNHLSPDPALDRSSVTFLATAGTTYNIAVGGYDFFGAENGNIRLNIGTGTGKAPQYYPATLTLTPSTVDVTTAPVNVTAAFTIQAASGNGRGTAAIGWKNSFGIASYRGTPAIWNTSFPQSGSPQVAYSVPLYTAPGTKMLLLKISPAGGGTELIFSTPDGGTGYALPPPAAQTLQVINTGLVDEIPPSLTAFSITPDNANVTTAPASLQVSATLTDMTAGVASVRVKLMFSPASGFATSLTRSAGTALNGTWTGNIAVPLLFPTGNYSVLVEASDAADNATDFGEFSLASREIPGPAGNLDIPIIGGGAYERWAWLSWFHAGDLLTGLLDDADGDGRPNLLSYAFDLNPLDIANSDGTLPVVELTGAGAARHLRITWLRRKASTNSGLTYSPQFTSSVTGVWQTVSGGTVTSVSADWESVVVDDAVNISGDSRRYGRVKVEYAAP